MLKKEKVNTEDKKHGERLSFYKVNALNKQFEFWQRDSLAIQLYNTEVVYKKLDYIHNNSLAEHWQLVKTPSDYKYSSAKFYEVVEKNFTFLNITGLSFN